MRRQPFNFSGGDVLQNGKIVSALSVARLIDPLSQESRGLGESAAATLSAMAEVLIEHVDESDVERKSGVFKLAADLMHHAAALCCVSPGLLKRFGWDI